MGSDQELAAGLKQEVRKWEEIVKTQTDDLHEQMQEAQRLRNFQNLQQENIGQLEGELEEKRAKIREYER